MKLRSTCMLIGVAFVAIATASQAAVHRVHAGESIQAAIDGASPGDTILVDPGTYQSSGGLYGLHVTTDNLRLIGKVDPELGDAGKVRVLAGPGQETGVFAAPPGCDYRGTSCPDELQGFYIRGFTVEGFPVNGIQTRWVNGFKFIANESVNNLNNGIYPTLSANGLVRDNVSYGSLDTSLWVAGSENVRVIGNELFGSPIGFEITVSNDVYAAHNDIHDNTVGIGLFHPNGAGNPPLPVMANWVFEHNHVYNNNLPNPAPPASFQAGLPAGVGVFLLGVSDHVIGKNVIENNDFVGIGVLGWCTATSLGDPARGCINSPPITPPTSDNNRIYKNTLLNNGNNPPPGFGALAADIIFLVTPPLEPGVGNCFEDNEFDTFVSFSGSLPTDGC